MTFLHQHAEDRAKGKVRFKPHAGPTIAELCERAGIDRKTYYNRRAAGLTKHEALSLGPQPGRGTLRKRLATVIADPINAALRAWR